MTLYRYEAYSHAGRAIDGTIEADSLPSALSLLRQKGVSPYRAEPASPQQQRSGFGAMLAANGPGLEWRARTIRQLATLLTAGITLDRALRILVSQAARRREGGIIEKLLSEVSSGKPLAAALAVAAGGFKADEIGLIRAGEQRGSLAPVLDELAALLERRLQLKGKLASALIYPAFLLALAPISLIIIATILVPNIAPLFEHSNAAMPLVLSAMIWATAEFESHGTLWLALLLLAIIAAWLASRSSHVRGRASQLVGHLPLAGVIRRRARASRICRTLGSLLRSGAPLQQALASVAEVAAGEAVQQALRGAQLEVSGGAKLAVALKSVSCLDSQALQMIAIGEETNKLDVMLLYVADSEEKALASYIDRLMALLTPALTVAIGLFVGGIVMSIMRAILSVNELVGQ